MPSLSFEGLGLIEYDPARTPLQQNFALVHELAHHLLWLREPGAPFSMDIRDGYDDDSRSERHLIAQTVE